MRIVAAVVLVCTLAACSRTPTREDAPGTYVLHNAAVSDTLWIAPDGGYVHAIRPGGGEPVVSRGRWAFEPVGGEPGVMFTDFPARASMELPPEQWRRGYWPAFIRRTVTGTVVLPVDPASGAQYHRISTHLLGSGRRR